MAYPSPRRSDPGTPGSPSKISFASEDEDVKALPESELGDFLTKYDQSISKSSDLDNFLAEDD